MEEKYFKEIVSISIDLIEEYSFTKRDDNCEEVLEGLKCLYSWLGNYGKENKDGKS